MTRWFCVSLLLLLSSCAQVAAPPGPVPGDQAPDFALTQVGGGQVTLSAQRGQTVLLAFVDVRAPAGEAHDPSRGQLVFLKSMLRQYGPQGLTVLIVDAGTIAGRTAHDGPLVNASHDWQLAPIPLLIDDGAVAQRFGVTTSPTSLLLNAQGAVQQRWDGYTTAAQLALAIEALVGAPVQRRAEGARADVPRNTPCPTATAAQTRFAGIGMARPLSETIWVVDSGRPWRSDGPTPLQWVVLAAPSVTSPLRLRVSGESKTSGQSLLLVDATLEALPPSEALPMLTSLSRTDWNAYLLTMPITVPMSVTVTNCLTISAVVTTATDQPLSSGHAIVPITEVTRR
jgi:hypothetical protein